MYSTASMLRTIELILGLPPMSQFDAAATPMWECFTTSRDLTPFVSLDPSYDIHEMNMEENAISRLSDSFNLEVMDAAPDHLFSTVIWKAVRGLDSEMPAPAGKVCFYTTATRKRKWKKRVSIQSNLPCTAHYMIISILLLRNFVIRRSC